MNGAPPLETQRLRLRAFAATDTAFAVTLISTADVRRFLGGPVPAAQAERVARSYLDLKPREATWLVEAKDDLQPVGLIFLSQHKDGADFELSFMFAPRVWGKGYATEAARRVLDCARTEMGIFRLIAETQAANLASRALLERLGMREDRRVHRFGAEQIIYTS